MSTAKKVAPSASKKEIAHQSSEEHVLFSKENYKWMVIGLIIMTIGFFLMIRRPPRSTPLYSSAASDVYKRQAYGY